MRFWWSRSEVKTLHAVGCWIICRSPPFSLGFVTEAAVNTGQHKNNIMIKATTYLILYYLQSKKSTQFGKKNKKGDPIWLEVHTKKKEEKGYPI